MEIQEFLNSSKQVLIETLKQNSNQMSVVAVPGFSAEDIKILIKTFPKHFMIQNGNVKYSEPFVLRTLDEISDEEKIVKFNSIYNFAVETFKEVIENQGTDNGDTKHWCYEQVINLLGKGVWDEINKAIR